MTRKILYVGVAMLLVGLVGFEFFAGTRHEMLSVNSLLLALVGILPALISSFVLLLRRQRAGIIGLGAVAVTILAFIVLFTAGGRDIVASLTAPDGTEMCVIETPDGEDHQTGFYYRRPGQRWGWFYYEHEDSHWWVGRIRLTPDGTRAVLYRWFLPVAYFDIPTERFTIVRWGRTLSPAQRWMPEGWTPEDALKSVSSSGPPMEAGAPDNKPPEERK